MSISFLLGVGASGPCSPSIDSHRPARVSLGPGAQAELSPTVRPSQERGIGDFTHLWRRRGHATRSEVKDPPPGIPSVSMRGRALAGAAAAALGIAGCAGSASNPLCADSGCAEVSGIVQTCDGAQPGRCHPEPVDAVDLVDDHGHVAQQARGDAGHQLSGQFLFKGVTPGHYVLRTRALGRTWAQRVRAPVNATAHADITIRPR